eukprot:4486558-Pyramimonas_sp.AAC.1
MKKLAAFLGLGLVWMVGFLSVNKFLSKKAVLADLESRQQTRPAIQAPSARKRFTTRLGGN